MTFQYIYKSIGTISVIDSKNVTIQGRICDIQDLPQNLGFYLTIFDQDSAQEYCDEIQCYFWSNQLLKYSKKMFKRNEIYNFVNPKIVQSNNNYHRHKCKIYIGSDTKIIKKSQFHIKKADKTCVESFVNKKTPKKIKEKSLTNSHKITKYFSPIKTESNSSKHKQTTPPVSMKNESKKSYQPTMDNWLQKN